MSLTQTDLSKAFTEALMLAILAPDDEKKDKALGLVARISTTLSETEQELCKMGIETCLEFMGKYP